MKNHIKYIFIILMASASGLKAQESANSIDSALMKMVKLGEIVIKASKDNVTFKSIPASVSVISAASISDNQIQSLNEISSSAPNFFMPDYGSKLTSPVYIRGIGSRINSPSVGLYVDYVPYFEKAAFDFDFFDIKRIEVLRGPQGTLFGRNTMGGIVNIVTTSPMDYTGTHLNLSAGNYGTYSVNGGHYGKLGNRFGYSLALNYVHNDGFFTNQFTGNQVDKLNSYGLRNRLIYEVSKKLTVENIIGFELSKQGGYPYALYNDSTMLAEKINYNQYSSYNRALFSDALLIKYTTSGFDLTATTSYQYLDDLQDIDQDFTPSSLFFISQKQKQNMVSQEVVIRSNGKHKYNWLLGGYGFYQAFDNAVNVDSYAASLSYLKTYDHKIDGYAFFHQSSLNDFLIKDLTVTGGIRIDSEKDQLDYTYDRNLKGVQANLADTLYPALESLEIIPRMAINYKILKSNLYVVIARGYKTGGFNSTFERPEDLTFNPEYSWNYEIGVKTPMLNNYIYADVALFYIDWKNQQIYQTVPSGRGSMLKNAGHSVSKGGELSIKTIPVKGFEFNISYGYTNATFISYEVNATTNYNGNYLPYVPRHTLSLQTTKSIKVNNSSMLDNIRVNLLYRGAGNIYWDEKNSVSQPFYGLIDGKVSFVKKSMQFDIWAKNILNTYYEAFYFEALGNKYVQTGKPAQVGINLSVKF
ncbi:MAG: TonB-dependent receptor [Bacteroidales bacterium]|nr:TonB-dependent receptor [Bacteroidales bacterium]